MDDNTKIETEEITEIGDTKQIEGGEKAVFKGGVNTKETSRSKRLVEKSAPNTKIFIYNANFTMSFNITHSRRGWIDILRPDNSTSESFSVLFRGSLRTKNKLKTKKRN